MFSNFIYSLIRD